MRETYYAAGYWYVRQESASECARRAEAYFQGLARCDPIYAQWFEKARSLKEALKRRFEPTQATFEAFFAKKKYQGAGGYHFGAWTGHVQEGHGGMARFSCGAPFRGVPCSCILDLPSESPDQERILTVPMLIRILRTMVLACEPDWGRVTSSDYPRDTPRRVRTVGWLTYFSHACGTVPPLPAPVRVEPLEDKGTLIILTPERFTVSNPEHVALAGHVTELLERAELLGDLRR